MQKSDTYAPQIQAMITTKPGEFSYCYTADTVHAIATCDAQSSKAPDTRVVWLNTGFGGSDVSASMTPRFQHTQTGHAVEYVRANAFPTDVYAHELGVRRLRYGGYLFSQNASVYHTYRCAKPDIQDPSGVAHCERPTETDDTPEVESPDTP